MVLVNRLKGHLQHSNPKSLQHMLFSCC